MAQNVERIPEHQTFLEDDLHKAQFKLKQTELKLEEIAAQQSRYSFTKSVNINDTFWSQAFSRKKFLQPSILL